MGREQPSVAPSLSASSRNFCTLASSPIPRPMDRMNSAPVISTSSPADGSMNSRLRTRDLTAGAGRLGYGRRAAALGRLEHTAADCEQHHRLARKIDFDVDLLTIAAARRDQARRPGTPRRTRRWQSRSRSWPPAPRHNRRNRCCAAPARPLACAPRSARPSRLRRSRDRTRAAATCTVTISSTPATLTAGISAAGLAAISATVTVSPLRRSGLRCGDQFQCDRAAVRRGAARR